MNFKNKYLKYHKKGNEKYGTVICPNGHKGKKECEEFGCTFISHKEDVEKFGNFIRDSCYNPPMIYDIKKISYPISFYQLKISSEPFNLLLFGDQHFSLDNSCEPCGDDCVTFIELVNDIISHYLYLFVITDDPSATSPKNKSIEVRLGA